MAFCSRPTVRRFGPDEVVVVSNGDFIWTGGAIDPITEFRLQSSNLNMPSPFEDSGTATFRGSGTFSGTAPPGGDAAGDAFGVSVGGAMDVNKDGHADLIVGAWSDGNNNREFSGSARVLSGKDGKILYTFNGDSAYDRFGVSVGGAGDVNRDGFADLIVGAPFRGRGSARV